MGSTEALSVVDQRVWCLPWRARKPCEVDLAEIQRALSTRGLHVITAKQKAVLDAAARSGIYKGRNGPYFTTGGNAVAEAELALREAKQ
jgi:hypothetical protein